MLLRRLPLVAGAFALVLVAGLIANIVAWQMEASKPPEPAPAAVPAAEVAQAYLTALERGDVTGAYRMTVAGVPPNEPLVTDAVYAAADARISQPQVTPPSSEPVSGSTVVSATYMLGGTPQSTQLSMTRHGDHWLLDRGFGLPHVRVGSTVESLTQERTLQIPGLAGPLPVRSGSATEVAVLPGRYAFEVQATDFFAAQHGFLNTWRDPRITITEEATGRFRNDAIAAAEAQLATCEASTDKAPGPLCPFGLANEGAPPYTDVRYRIARDAAPYRFERNASGVAGAGAWQLTADGGRVEQSATVQFPDGPRPHDSSQAFTVRYLVTVDPEGRVVLHPPA